LTQVWLTCFKSNKMVTYSNCRPPCRVGDCHQPSSSPETVEISDCMERCLAWSEEWALQMPHGLAPTCLQYSSAPFWPHVAFTDISARGITLKSGG